MTITRPKGKRDIQVTLLKKETTKEEQLAKNANIDQVLSSWETLAQEELKVDITNIEKRLLGEFKKAASRKN